MHYRHPPSLTDGIDGLQFSLQRVHAPEKGVYAMVMALDGQIWEPEHEWRDDAACSGTDADLFFPPGEDETAAMAAKRICGMCPVQEQCLQYALATNQTEGGTVAASVAVYAIGNAASAPANPSRLPAQASPHIGPRPRETLGSGFVDRH